MAGRLTIKHATLVVALSAVVGFTALFWRDANANQPKSGERLALVANITPSPAGEVQPGVMQATQESSAEAIQPAEPAEDPLLTFAKKAGYSYPAAPAKNRSKEEFEAFVKSSSCTACHTGYDGIYEHTMHPSNVMINCVDCHGGDATVAVPRDIDEKSPLWKPLMEKAHPKAKIPHLWESSANPKAPAAETLKESPDYIRFVNPGDLHAAVVACGQCHAQEVRFVERSMMSHGAMLWNAALYNNGAINLKNAVFGESYTVDGQPREIMPIQPLKDAIAGVMDVEVRPTLMREMIYKGHVPSLLPLPRWNITQPGNILRVFEKGGRRRPILGVPDIAEDPGRPEVRLSIRGLGTDVRTDPVFIGLQKTRLLDPTLTMFGTNDHPGDYRGSGCTACHVVYANDRSPVHSGDWAKYGNMGKTVNPDRTISKDESGHPIKHQFQKQMPSSTCMVCHVHPGTIVVNSYFGYQWWDNEVDGKQMWPAEQKNPSEDDHYKVSRHNPEGSAPKGLWSDLYPNDKSIAGKVAGKDFLANVSDLNPSLTRTQFADFHGHGWIYRAVYKHDSEGNMLDSDGNKVENLSAEKLKAAVDFNTQPLIAKAPTSRPANDLHTPPPGQPVHLKDIHLEKGMSCVDCHFAQDMHGDGVLYKETRAAIMEECIDCHGSEAEPAKMMQYLQLSKESLPRARTPAERARVAQLTKEREEKLNGLLLSSWTGNAADNGWPKEMQIARNKKIIDTKFEIKDGKLWQKSALDPTKGWFVVQTVDSINPSSWWAKDKNTHKDSPEAARYAHTIRKDGTTWGSVPPEGTSGDLELAHGSNDMACYACHTSWTTACFGCHLPMRANMKRDRLHYEGESARNYTNYNFQTLRDDYFMLGKDSTVKGNKIVPIRSSCAILVSSQDALRQWIYAQQQTISAEGYSGQAFSAYFPHTVRSIETKRCTDCHVSKENDNNAKVAQTLIQGLNGVNFIGRFAYVGMGDHGLEAVAVTHRSEPQAVFGSTLDKMAYPDDYADHLKRGLQVKQAHTHHGNILDLQLRGEYVYAACGEDGFRVYDVANIDNKGFSERIVTAPVSPFGQRLKVATKYATSVTSPSTLALDPTRPQLKENQESPIPLLFGFIYVTDKYEGLVVVGNLGENAKKWNIGVATLLDGNPENNFLTKALSFNPDGILNGAYRMTLYGTLAYITCDAGIVVVDLQDPTAPKVVTTITGLNKPKKVEFQFRYGFFVDAEGMKVLDVTDPRNPRLVPGAGVPIADARDIYLSRTYAYIAAGKEGVKIVDIKKPEAPALDQTFNADGAIVDATAVRTGMTNASMYLYIADGVGGLKVAQLTDPDSMPTFNGFSPRPAPRLIARHKTPGPAIALSEGLDRDRAVDELGNQLTVFGRVGARPFNFEEQRRLYLKNGVPFFVSDKPSTPPLEYVAPKK